jgi:hypothetical protein
MVRFNRIWTFLFLMSVSCAVLISSAAFAMNDPK